MKIIFLDVDGVLNHRDTPDWVMSELHALDMKCVAELRRVLDATGAKIVVSSTWRFSPTAMRTLLDALPENVVIGKTPFSARNIDDPRSIEILKWMAKVWPQSWGVDPFSVITHLAVIDDDNDADLGDGSFFKTEFEEGGLTAEIADSMIAHLNKAK